MFLWCVKYLDTCGCMTITECEEFVYAWTKWGGAWKKFSKKFKNANFYTCRECIASYFCMRDDITMVRKINYKNISDMEKYENEILL